jgi:hypothetical protein
MSGRRWNFVVQDARGRKHRGIVTWSERLASPQAPPETPATFRIDVLAQATDVAEPPERTAICVPGVPRLRAIRPGDSAPLPRKIADLTLPPHKMAEYASGRIVMAAEGIIEPGDVFPAHSDHPRLDRLALAIVEVAAAEAIAPYIAIIRHELGIRAGSDALAALGERLAPEDAAARPPARAPGVLRLARALRRLRDGLAPVDTPDQISEDLRFLRLFATDEPVLERDALEKLLTDVRDKSPDTSASSKIVPLRRKRDGQ